MCTEGKWKLTDDVGLQDVARQRTDFRCILWENMSLSNHVTSRVKENSTEGGETVEG